MFNSNSETLCKSKSTLNQMNSLFFSADKPWLAPLAGYSDLPFRLLCRGHGAHAACTEMVSVKGLCYGTKNTWPLLDTSKQDSPLIVQLFGAEPDTFARAMDILLEKNYRYFDLNSGCSVKKVVKTGSGAALMTDPDLLVKITSVMARAAGAGKVGVKLRLGYQLNEDTYLDTAKRLEQAGAGWITLHPRYARQGFGGKADWSHLAVLARSLTIPVLGSGDLFTPADGVEMIRQTGIASLMFARGALIDPAIFKKYNKLLNGETVSPPDGPETAAIVRQHVDLAREYYGSGKYLRRMRSLVPRYIKGLSGAREMRSRIIKCDQWEDLLRLCDEIEEMVLPER